MEAIETKLEQLTDYGQHSNQVLNELVSTEYRYLRDVRVSLKNVLNSQHLSEKETSLLALAVATNNGNQKLISSFKEMATEADASSEELAETISCASLLASNNVLYRFRHFTGKEKYNELQAGIRMNIMARPVLEKGLFELISLAVSAVNGCEMCVNSHEATVLEHGYSEEQIWDAIRLASVVTSFGKIVF